MSCSVGARPNAFPHRPKARLGVVEAVAIGRSHRAGTAPIDVAIPHPLWSAGDLDGTANPADGDAGPDRLVVVSLSLAADHDDAEGQGLVLGHFSNIVDRFVANSVSAYRMALHGTRLTSPKALGGAVPKPKRY
jgi:hypothetical protein